MKRPGALTRRSGFPRPRKDRPGPPRQRLGGPSCGPGYIADTIKLFWCGLGVQLNIYAFNVHAQVMAWELRTGGVSGHITSYVYVRANGVNGHIPPNMTIIAPGVLWDSRCQVADHRLHLNFDIVSKSQVLIPSKLGRQGHRNVGCLEARIVGRSLPDI